MSSSNNNLSDYYNPVYLQGFEYVNYFNDYKSNSDNWIKLVYYIDRDRFKSSLGTNKVLRNHTAYNGNSIFNTGDKIDFDKYRLKEETVEASDIPNVYKVSEIYGYAPDFVHTYYKSSLVNRIGYVDTSVVANCKVGTAAYVPESDEIKIRVSATNQTNLLQNFKVGDVVTFSRQQNFANAGGSIQTLYGGRSSKTQIKKFGQSSMEVDGTTYYYTDVYVDATFTFFIYDSDTFNTQAITGASIVYVFNDKYIYNGNTVLVANCSIHKSEENIPTTVSKKTVKVLVSFLEEPPEQLEQKFTPKDNKGAEVDTINDYTTPSTTVWKKILNGTATQQDIAGIDGITSDGYMLVDDAELEDFHGIYKKELYYTKIT